MKNYEGLTIKVVLLSNEDVVTTSGEGKNDLTQDDPFVGVLFAG